LSRVVVVGRSCVVRNVSVGGNIGVVGWCGWRGCVSRLGRVVCGLGECGLGVQEASGILWPGFG
jgi:hypothetical protein